MNQQRTIQNRLEVSEEEVSHTIAHSADFENGLASELMMLVCINWEE